MQSGSVALGMAKSAWWSTTFVFDWNISDHDRMDFHEMWNKFSKIQVRTNSNWFKRNSFRAMRGPVMCVRRCSQRVSVNFPVCCYTAALWLLRLWCDLYCGSSSIIVLKTFSPHNANGPHTLGRKSFGKDPEGECGGKIGSRTRLYKCSTCFWGLCCHLGGKLAGESSDLLFEVYLEKLIKFICKTNKPTPIWLIVSWVHNKKKMI